MRAITKGMLETFGAWARLVVVALFSLVVAIGLAGQLGPPALVVGLVVGVYVAAEVAVSLGGLFVSGKALAAWVYSVLWWPLRHKLGFSCPFCGGPMPATSRLAALDHMTECPGTDQAQRLAWIEATLTADAVASALDGLDPDQDDLAYTALLDYADMLERLRYETH